MDDFAEEKLEAPTSRLQRNFKHQIPKARRERRCIGAWLLELLWMLELGIWSFLQSPNCSGIHFPPLQIFSQFTRPVFFGGGHEHLAARFARVLQQRQETAAPFRVQFA